MGVVDGLTDDELQQLCACFTRPDDSNDGFVSPNEVPAFLATQFGGVDVATLERLKNILLVQADRSNDGKIDLREFIMIVKDSNIDALRNLLDPEHIGDAEYAAVRNIMSRLAPDEMDMYRDAFIKLDTNGDGMLDIDEVMTGVEAVLKERFAPMKEYLEKIFDVADKDRDNMLCLREFMGSFADGPGVVPHEVILDATALVRVRLSDDEVARLQIAFREMDENSDGFLDRAELKAGLKKELQGMYPKHTDAQFDELVSVVLATADRDRDGKLNISEFIRSFQEEQGVLPSAFLGHLDAGDDTQPSTSAAAQQQQQQQRPAAVIRLTKEQHKFLSDAFRGIDTNDDGYLDPAEMQQAVTNAVLSMMPERADDNDAINRVVEQIMTTGDLNHDGRISWKEFVASFVNNSEIVEVMEEVAETAASGFHSNLTPEEVLNLKHAFAALDTNGDGFVSRKELAHAVKRMVDESRLRKDIVQEIVDSIIGTADADGDQKLTVAEFVRAFAQGEQVMDLAYAAAIAADVAKRSKNALRRDQVEALKEAFAVLDKNCDGYVDRDELRSSLFSLLHAEYKDEAQVQEIIDIILSAADSNHDGKLSLTEFIRAFNKNVEIMMVPVAAADAMLSTREQILRALDADEIAALHQAFMALDTNGDGYLNAREFKNAVQLIVDKTVRKEVVPEVVKIIMDVADADRDGRVSFTEFLFAFTQDPEIMNAAFAAAAAKEAARKAKHSLTGEQIQQIKSQFEALDRNGDGFLSRAELISAVRGIIEPHAANREQFVADLVDLILRAADTNKDGKLNLTEFVRAFVQHADVMEVASAAAHVSQEERVAALRSQLMADETVNLRNMFRALDVNNDGELDRQELADGVRTLLAQSMSDTTTVDSIVQQIIDAADADKNGKLSLQEFLSAYYACPEFIAPGVSDVVASAASPDGASKHADRVAKMKSKLLGSEIEALQKVFGLLDINKDGFLDEAELENAVRAILNRGLIDERSVNQVVYAILQAADTEHKGRISLGDFISAFETVPTVMGITLAAADAIQAHARLLSHITKDEYEQLRVAFATIDKNHDGFLTREELVNSISTMVTSSVADQEIVGRVVDLILSTASERHDGRICLNDFIQNFVTHQEIMSAPVQAAISELQKSESGHGTPRQSVDETNAPSNAAVNTSSSSRGGVLVPAPPSQASSSISPSSRSRRRPGATTRELLVEASPIVNDVSGVPVSDEQLHLEFETLDVDQSGKLNKTEFKKYFMTLENYGVPMTEAQFEQQWSRLCGPKESTITFERFALFMLRRSRM